jgi:anti-anti-sigma factor
MPIVSREGFTVRILRAGSSSGAGLGLLLTSRHVVTCAHVVNVALGRDQLAQDKPAEDALIQVEFPLLGNTEAAPVRSCAIGRWVPPPISGALGGGDVAVLEIKRGDLPPGSGPARVIDPSPLRGIVADVFGYPADPDRRQAGAWSRHRLRGRVGRGVLQLDASTGSAVVAQPGYSGSPIVVAEGGSDAVIGILSAAGRQSRDAYAIPVAALADAWPEALGPVLMPECPYRWLSPFTQADADQGLFVGREQDVTELSRLAAREAVVVVTGSSGVGKSSLLAAGVAKTLDHEGWAIAHIRPGGTPVDDLATTLLKLERPSSGRTARAIQARARQLRSAGLAALGSRVALAAGKPILICVDPLDVIFSEALCSPPQRSQFLEIILSAAEAPAGGVHVACALRSDLMSGLLDHPGSASRLQGRLYMVSPLGTDSVKRVIEEPALRRGVSYDQGLVSVIADDAGDGRSLPLLEFALAELWSYQRQRHISLDDYVRLGRVGGVLGRHAEQAFQAVSAECSEDQIRRVMLSFIVASSPATLRPVARGRVTEEQQALIRRLIEARLVISRKEGEHGDDVYEIAHAALLENWGRLAAWIVEDRKFLDWCSQMRTFMPGDLLPDARLAEARKWLAERAVDIDEDVRGLIERSQTHYEWQVRELLEARDAAETAARRAESLRLASLSEQATDAQASVGIALAVESLIRIHTVQGDLALRRALVHAAEPFSLSGHDRPVTAITFSHNGELIATGDEDGVTRVFTDTGERKGTHRQPSPVRDLAFSHSGEWIVTAGGSGTADVIEAATGKLAGRIEHGDMFNSAVFSPNGRLVATACDDGVARVFRWSRNQKVGEIPHDGPVRAVRFSRDGRLIATASDDGTARVYRLGTKKEQSRFIHAGPVNSVAFSPSGDLIVTSSDDEFACVFRAHDGAEVSRFRLGSPVKAAIFSHSGDFIALTGGMPDRGVLRIHRCNNGSLLMECQDREALGCVMFSHDDELIVVAGRSGAVRVFEVATRTEWTGVSHDGPVNSVDFSPGARKAASAGADCSAHIFDPAPGPERCRVSHKETVSHVEFIPGQERLMSASADGIVLISDPATGEVLRILAHDVAVHAVLFSPAGNFVVMGGDDGVALVLDMSTGAERGRLVHDGPVRSVAASRDGTWVATGSGDRTAQILQVDTGRPHLRIPHAGPVTSVNFSSDGRWIATANGGRGDAPSAHIFAVESGAEHLALPHPAWVNEAVFSADGKWLATASDDGAAQVFDTATGQRQSLLMHGGRVGGVSFSGDGQWVVTASDDGTARVFSPGEGLERSRLVHDKWVNAAVFSRHGDLVATASDDGTARTFDPATGIERNRVAHQRPVRSVAISPDGEWLATGSVDRSLRVSPIGFSSLLTTAKMRMSRSLTAGEQRRYELTSLLGQNAEVGSGEERVKLRGRGDPSFNWFRRGDYVVLEVGGELDVYTMTALHDVLVNLVNRGCYRIIMDMREVEFLDSAALGVIVGGVKRTRAHDGMFKVVSDQERINKVFRLTGLIKAIPIYSTVEEALVAPEWGSRRGVAK